jgi:hypothetical protein
VVVFINLSRQIPEQHLEIGHDHLLSNLYLSKFISIFPTHSPKNEKNPCGESKLAVQPLDGHLTD